tara:strand:- start:40 stop:180 length:141 start_codon:yes stop_codon:yes gene_type:complete
MSQRGNKAGVVQRIETLKGWALSLGKQYGKEIPLVAKPVVRRPRKS